ncbi:MAG: hypothetical protein F6K19_10790 [Cyanothece sp. SIO1E1]|nr:hypothetical protein [Cyanothece sp. SIO1E1]
MLYLAQIHRKLPLRGTELQLLACQKDDYIWETISTEDIVISPDANVFHKGNLVLVELDEEKQVQKVQDATAWVLDLVSQYLTIGITPMTLQAEIELAEQWRQSLTLQSQEVGRRTLEIEARRDQIQELEERLKREKEKLGLLDSKLDFNENSSNPS